MVMSRTVAAEDCLPRIHASRFWCKWKLRSKLQPALRRALFRKLVISRIQIQPNPSTAETFGHGSNGATAHERIEHAISEATTGEDARLHELLRRRGEVGTCVGHRRDGPDAATVAPAFGVSQSPAMVPRWCR